MAAADLVAAAGRLRPMLTELAALNGCGQAWSLRVLRRNVEIALLSPETLETAENQLDFIEELAEAVWDGSDPGIRLATASGGGAEELAAREARRQAIVAQLDELADGLCREAERWQQLFPPSGRDLAPDADDGDGNPQPAHRL